MIFTAGINKIRPMQAAENLLWYVYLVLLVMLAFLPVRYDSDAWLRLTGYFHLFASAYLLILIAGGDYNKKAFSRAKPAILFLSLSLIWLSIQSIFPVNKSVLLELFSVNAPSWYSADFSSISEYQKSRLQLFASIAFFSWFILSMAIVRNRRRVQQLLVCLVLIGLLQASIGLYAKFGNLILVDRQALDGHFDAARGLFVNRNHYAGFITITLLGAITYFFKSIMQRRQSSGFILAALDLLLSPRLVLVFASIVGVIALMLSQSRAGVFAFLFFFSAVTLVFLLSDRRISRKRYLLLLPMALLIVLTVFFGQDLLARLLSDGFTLGERTTQWEITWQAIKDSPISGFGAGNYSTVFQVYREQSDLRQVVFDQSHNEYLHLWLEQGLIGLVLFLAFIATVLRTIIRTYKNTNSRLISALMLAAMVVLLSALAQSLVDFNLQIVNIRAFFLIVIALVYSSNALFVKS